VHTLAQLHTPRISADSAGACSRFAHAVVNSALLLFSLTFND